MIAEKTEAALKIFSYRGIVTMPPHIEKAIDFVA